MMTPPEPVMRDRASLAVWVLSGLVRAYRLLLSPWLGSSCRFEPTCSAYALQALDRHGAVTGGRLTLWRLARCQPWCQGGHDPVPDRATGLFTSLFQRAGTDAPLPVPPDLGNPSSDLRKKSL
jgi:putative membrane protein insertion efficiency factor